MSGKQKECGYSWTSEGEIHTCSLPEGHTEAHICGFVFNPDDCCLERAAPTPPEGEAVPEQVMCNWRQDGNPPFNCKLPANHSGDHSPVSSPIPAPVVSTAASEPESVTGGIYVGEDKPHKVDGERLREIFDRGFTTSPVDPESYKPAEGPGYCNIAKRIVSRQGSETVVLENGDCTELYWHLENCDACAWLRPAATPVTVEAPENLAYQFKEELNAKLDAALATPKPIGDVEAVNEAIKDAIEELFRHICVRMPKNSVLPIKFSEAETIMRSHLSPIFAPAPPCSECATPSDKWSPVIAEAFKVQKVNMNCFKLYFFGSFLGAHHSQKSAENRAGMLSDLILKWTNKYAKLLTNELINAKTECATQHKERDDAEKAIAKALRFTPSEEEPEECAPWMVEAEPEPMGPFSLIEAITAMMEMFDREFSKADKCAEAAEAQLSTLRDALEAIVNFFRSNWEPGEIAEMFNPSSASIFAKYLNQAEAALAPTPEIAK